MNELRQSVAVQATVLMTVFLEEGRKVGSERRNGEGGIEKRRSPIIGLSIGLPGRQSDRPCSWRGLVVFVEYWSRSFGNQTVVSLGGG